MIQKTAITEPYFEGIVEQPFFIRIVAKFLSYLFHPVFIPTIITAILLWLQPVNRLLISDFNKPRMLAMVILYTAFFPLLAVLLLWRLKFIQNIYLRTQKERIIPFVTSMFFFFWMYYIGRNLDYFPLALKQFLMGLFISSASALFANIYTKISMHAMGVGGMVGFAFVQQFVDGYWPSNWSLIALLIAGAVCTTRLILKEHKPVDIYAGFFTGVLCQVGASFMMN